MDDTLESVLEWLHRNDVDDLRIYSQVAPTDAQGLAALMAEFQIVEDEQHVTGNGTSKSAWNVSQRQRKGECFERMMRKMLPNVFESWQRVQTDTNELDILIGLGPRCNWFPPLRQWGSHAICECKSNRDTFTVNWVDKLAGVLQKHGACVGIVMSKRAPKNRGNAGRALDSIRIYAALGRVLLLVDMDDVRKCIAGENALRLISLRYLEAQAGIRRQQLISTGRLIS